MKKILSLILLALFAFTQKSYAMEKPIIKSVLGRVIRNLNPVRDLRSLLSGPEELNSEELVYESEDSLDEESTSSYEEPEIIIESDYEETVYEIAEEQPESLIFKLLEGKRFEEIIKGLESGNIDIDNIYSPENINLYEILINLSFKYFKKCRNILRILIEKKYRMDLLSNAYNLLHKQIESGTGKVELTSLLLIEREVLLKLIKLNRDNPEKLSNLLRITSKRKGYYGYVIEIIKVSRILEKEALKEAVLYAIENRSMVIIEKIFEKYENYISEEDFLQICIEKTRSLQELYRRKKNSYKKIEYFFNLIFAKKFLAPVAKRQIEEYHQKRQQAKQT